MKPYLYPALILLVLAAIGGYAYVTQVPEPSPEEETVLPSDSAAPSESEEAPIEPAASPAGTAAPEPGISSQPAAPSGITLAEVALHGDATSCWSVVRGEVYDLTAWIAKHPGGKKAVLGMCGRDATEDYLSQHGGEEKPEAKLASFRIGTLAK